MCPRSQVKLANVNEMGPDGGFTCLLNAMKKVCIRDLLEQTNHVLLP